MRREAVGDGEKCDLNWSGAILEADRHGATARVLSCELSNLFHIFSEFKDFTISFLLISGHRHRASSEKN